MAIQIPEMLREDALRIDRVEDKATVCQVLPRRRPDPLPDSESKAMGVAAMNVQRILPTMKRLLRWTWVIPIEATARTRVALETRTD